VIGVDVAAPLTRSPLVAIEEALLVFLAVLAQFQGSGVRKRAYRLVSFDDRFGTWGVVTILLLVVEI
jgi:hypothetical protein